MATLEGCHVEEDRLKAGMCDAVSVVYVKKEDENYEGKKS